MKMLIHFWAALLLAALLAFPGQAQPQVGALVVDQAVVVPSIATPGQGTVWGLHEHTDAQGTTYQAGTFSGTIHFGSFTLTSPGAIGNSPDYEAFVAKRSASGTYQWAIMGGGLGFQGIAGLALDAAGDIVVTGSYNSPTMTLGTTTLTNAAVSTTTSYDIFVARLNTAGTWQWATSAGGSARTGGSNEDARSIAVDGFGNIYVTGAFTSRTVFFGPTISLLSPDPDNAGRTALYVAKLDPAGVWQWARRSETTAMTPMGLVIDDFADIYVAANYSFRAAVGAFQYVAPAYRNSTSGTAIAKLNGSGQWQWLTVSESSSRNSVYCNGLKLGAQGELYTVGTFNGDTAIFGATRLLNTGSFLPSGQINMAPYFRTSDAYLARLDARTGAWQWVADTEGTGDESMSLPFAEVPGLLYINASFREVTGNLSPTPVPGATFGGATFYNASGADNLVAQLDTAGHWRWIGQGNLRSGEALGISRIDAQGQLRLGGRFTNASMQLGSITLTADPTAYYTPATIFTARLDPRSLLANAAVRPASAFSVYPNPTSRGQVAVVGLTAGQAVQVLDVLGRPVSGGVVPAHGNLELLLPAALPAGLYLVRAGRKTQRLLVE